MISKMSSIALILIYFAITYQGNIFTGKFKDLFNKSVKEGSFVVAICGRVVNMIILRTLRVSNTNAIIDCMAFRGGRVPFSPPPTLKKAVTSLTARGLIASLAAVFWISRNVPTSRLRGRLGEEID